MQLTSNLKFDTRLKQETKNITWDLKDFREITSIKNQLKLDVTIF